MADINLLGLEKKQPTLPWQTLSTIIFRLLMVVLVLVFVTWGGLYYLTKASQNQIFDTQNAIKEQTAKLADLPERKQVLARQAQLKAYNSVLSEQAHWSYFLTSKLAPVTLNSARYVSINTDNEGRIHMNVSVPSYVDLDKFLQIFDYPELNKVFTDIKVTALSKSQVGDKTEIRFDVSMQYNPQAIRVEK